jgi:hypothetical protein
MQRFALVALFGPQKIVMAPGLAVGPEARNNRWGDGVIDELADSEFAELTTALPRLRPLSEAPKAASYADAPGALEGEPMSMPRGSRPLGFDRENSLSMADLAQELEVDAVISIEHGFGVFGTEVEGSRGQATLLIRIIGKDGARLWNQRETCESTIESRPAGASVIDRLVLEEAPTRRALVRAALACLDRWKTEWHAAHQAANAG